MYSFVTLESVLLLRVFVVEGTVNHKNIIINFCLIKLLHEIILFLQAKLIIIWAFFRKTHRKTFLSQQNKRHRPPSFYPLLTMASPPAEGFEPCPIINPSSLFLVSIHNSSNVWYILVGLPPGHRRHGIWKNKGDANSKNDCCVKIVGNIRLRGGGWVRHSYY